MTRMNTLNFPKTFAVFRRHHSALTFQIIKATETYDATNTYTLDNENIGNPETWQRYQSVELTSLPYENSETVYVKASRSANSYRMRWSSIGLFIKIYNFSPSFNQTFIPILTISDYSLLPPTTPYSICFVEHNFSRHVHNIIQDTEINESRQWLSLEHLIENWFRYANSQDYNTYSSRHSIDIPNFGSGPDDRDDRRTIPQEQLIGAGVHRNTRRRYANPQEYLSELNDREEEVNVNTSRRTPSTTSNENRYVGAGATPSSSSSNTQSSTQTPIRLQKFTIDAIIDYAVNTEMDCPISMVKLTRDNCGVLSCQHVFEKDSIQRWMASNTHCPLCRETSVIC